MVKTLDNLEAGDVVSGQGNRYTVMLVQGEHIIGVIDGSASAYHLRVSKMKELNYMVDKPLNAAEKAAKAILEAVGFKVTR